MYKCGSHYISVGPCCTKTALPFDLDGLFYPLLTPKSTPNWVLGLFLFWGGAPNSPSQLLTQSLVTKKMALGDQSS